MQLGDDDQKLYTITVRGLGELGDWWTAVPADDPPPRDELMLKVLIAIFPIIGALAILLVIPAPAAVATLIVSAIAQKARPITVSTISLD
jgi:hypothetical protein